MDISVRYEESAPPPVKTVTLVLSREEVQNLFTVLNYAAATVSSSNLTDERERLFGNYVFRGQYMVAPLRDQLRDALDIERR